MQVDALGGDSRYPSFAPAAPTMGVASCLSAPITASSQTIEGLNFYAEAHTPSTNQRSRPAKRVAGNASLLVASSQAHHRSFEPLVDTQHVALDSPADIEQAKDGNGTDDQEPF